MERSSLHFQEEVRTHFSFLESLGFRILQSQMTSVLFESPELTITVYHDRLSYEIGLWIGTQADSYSFGEILSLTDLKAGEAYRDFVAQSEQAVVQGVRRLAEQFRDCLPLAPLDDVGMVMQLAQYRSERAENYAHEIQLFQARKESDVAWKGKDYSRVVEVLQPLRASLSSAERSKLEYAEKQCRCNP